MNSQTFKKAGSDSKVGKNSVADGSFGYLIVVVVHLSDFSGHIKILE